MEEAGEVRWARNDEPLNAAKEHHAGRMKERTYQKYMYTPSTSLFLSTFRQLMHLSSYLEHLNILTRIVNISRLVYS